MLITLYISISRYNERLLVHTYDANSLLIDF